MIKKLAPLIATLWLTACGEPEIPESYGVYARLTNGDLVQLDREGEIQNTKMVFFGNSSSISMSEAIKAPRFNYILRKPNTTIEMDEVEGFIVFGEKQPDKNVRIKYFADAMSFNGKFFDNNGKGAVNEATYLDQGWSCAQADGMSYKKLQENMYLFALPDTEKEAYKFCQLASYKEAGKGSRKSPHVAVDFYGWYYDGAYWTFNVAEEDSDGKEKELTRKQAIKDRIAESLAKKKAEEVAKKKKRAEQIKSYESAPVVKDLKYFSEIDNIFAYTAQNGDGEGFSLSAEYICLGAFCSRLVYKGINEFALDDLLKKHKAKVTEFKKTYSQKELLDSQVKVKDLNIPTSFNKKGWLRVAHSDTREHIEPLFGLYTISTKLAVNIASKEITPHLKNQDQRFAFGTELIAEGYNSYRDRGGMSFKLDISEALITAIGKKTAGKPSIEEVTLKYLKTDDLHRGTGTRSLFFVSSFKLKGIEGRFIISDSKDNKYIPHVYEALNIKLKNK